MKWTTLAADISEYITGWMDPSSYREWTSTCKNLLDLRKSKTNINNGQFVGAKVLRYVVGERKNVFMHGPAGTGKSHVLEALFNYVTNKTELQISMCSTTGISSCKLPRGKTIHSFSHLGMATKTLDQLKETKTLVDPLYSAYKKEKYKNWTNTDILVIDEVSMCGDKFLEKLDWMGKTVRENDLPFGGITIVMCGDFYQLPPVMDSYAFEGATWSSLNLYHVPFEINFRQKDDKQYANMLSRIRYGLHTDRDIKLLESKVEKYEFDYIKEIIRIGNGITKHFVSPQLMPKHKHVNEINAEYMECIQEPAENHNAQDEFFRVQDEKFIPCAPVPIGEKLRESIDYSVPATCVIKEGAQYFLTTNISVENGLVNGSRCIAFKTDDNETKLYFENGQTKTIESTMTSRIFNVAPSTILKRTNYALRPGYAATIHASQGMTLSEAVINLGKDIFAPSQSYVALSRVVSFKNLKLLDFSPKSLRTSDRVNAYWEHVGEQELLNRRMMKRKTIKRKPKEIIDCDSKKRIHVD